jgi:hypothetical protein
MVAVIPLNYTQIVSYSQEQKPKFVKPFCPQKILLIVAGKVSPFSHSDNRCKAKEASITVLKIL